MPEGSSVRESPTGRVWCPVPLSQDASCVTDSTVVPHPSWATLLPNSAKPTSNANEREKATQNRRKRHTNLRLPGARDASEAHAADSRCRGTPALVDAVDAVRA